MSVGHAATAVRIPDRLAHERVLNVVEPLLLPRGLPLAQFPDEVRRSTITTKEKKCKGEREEGGGWVGVETDESCALIIGTRRSSLGAARTCSSAKH